MASKLPVRPVRHRLRWTYRAIHIRLLVWLPINVRLLRFLGGGSCRRPSSEAIRANWGAIWVPLLSLPMRLGFLSELYRLCLLPIENLLAELCWLRRHWQLTAWCLCHCWHHPRSC